MANEAYLFRIVGCRCRKWQLREGGGKQNQLFIIKCFRGWALVFAGEAGFPALRRLNNREQRTDNSRQVGARNVTFQKSSHFSKISETVTAILLTKIDESSKLLKWVPRWDGHPAGVLEFLLFNRLGRWTTGRRLFTVYWLHSVFLRNNFRTWQCIHNVSMIKMNITHEIVNQSQFSRLKIRKFRHENLCVLSIPQSHFLLWKRSFHQDCLQTKLAIMY